jgi:hypothetical protein
MSTAVKKSAPRAGKKKAAAPAEGAVQKKRGEGQRVSENFDLRIQILNFPSFIVQVCRIEQGFIDFS